MQKTKHKVSDGNRKKLLKLIKGRKSHKNGGFFATLSKTLQTLNVVNYLEF